VTAYRRTLEPLRPILRARERRRLRHKLIDALPHFLTGIVFAGLAVGVLQAMLFLAAHP
jgi:hypothetical protein